MAHHAERARRQSKLWHLVRTTELADIALHPGLVHFALTAYYQSVLWRLAPRAAELADATLHPDLAHSAVTGHRQAELWHLWAKLAAAIVWSAEMGQSQSELFDLAPRATATGLAAGTVRRVPAD
jgi:hypothetical protein